MNIRSKAKVPLLIGKPEHVVQKVQLNGCLK